MSMLGIPVRYPKIDYNDFPKKWARNLPFCHDRNSQGVIPSPVEPWLIKIFQNILPTIPESERELREGVEAFIGQEAQHYRQHRQFIKRLVELGYTDLPRFEAELASELNEILETKSLKFILAYADGFEALGAVGAQIWFDESDEYIGGLDNAPIRMWKWHMAEEFEHREVCHDLFRYLYCRNFFTKITNGYFYRLKGLKFAMTHLGGFGVKMCRYMRRVDTAKMDDDERAEFYREMGVFKEFNKRVFLKALRPNLLPWYNPGRKKAPKGMAEYADRFSDGGEWSSRQIKSLAPARG